MRDIRLVQRRYGFGTIHLYKSCPNDQNLPTRKRMSMYTQNTAKIPGTYCGGNHPYGEAHACK